MADELQEQIARFLPVLRNRARKLTGNSADADDLVSAVYVKAVEKRDQYTMGTNLPAWLNTIMRHAYINDCRTHRRRFSVNIDAPDVVECLVSQPEQERALIAREEIALVGQLVPAQQEALCVLVLHASDYEDLAKRTGVELGTAKSRVARARELLRDMR